MTRALVVGLVACAGCYAPPEPDCGFACGTGGACPADYTCNAIGNICQRNGTTTSVACPDTRPFALVNANASALNTVVITFESAPAPSAFATGNYVFSPGLFVSGIEIVDNQATLTVGGMNLVEYTVTVSNVTRASDAAPLALSTAGFLGRPAFNVLGVHATSSTSVTVAFDALPDVASIAAPNAFVIDNLEQLAAPQLVGTSVVLTTTPQSPVFYTVHVTGVGRAVDGEVVSGGPFTFSGFPTCPLFEVADDGTFGQGGQALVIVMVRPSAHGWVELYNTSSMDIDLSTTTYTLVAAGASFALSSLGTTIRAGGYLDFAWPAGFPDETAGGELVLYADATLAPPSIRDFVCWDSDTATPSAKADAQSVGKWSTPVPACAAALTDTSLMRQQFSSGLFGSDYFSTSQLPMTCP